jgi:hypothetical protein
MSVTAPGSVPLSISARITAPRRASRSDEKPSDSGRLRYARHAATQEHHARDHGD